MCWVSRAVMGVYGLVFCVACPLGEARGDAPGVDPLSDEKPHTHEHDPSHDHHHDPLLDEPSDDDLSFGGDEGEGEVFETLAHGEKSASERRFEGQQVQQNPATFTAEDLLKLIPNLLLVQHGSEGKGQQLFLRGFDAAHGADVEVSFDGIPINEWSHVHAQGYLDFSFLIPEVIRSLHVTKGPIRADQGLFATAGSVNFALGIDPEQRGGRVTYEAGTTNRHRLLGIWAPIDAPNTSFVALEALHDDGPGQSRRAQRLSLNGQQRLWESDDASAHLDLMALGYVARFGLPGLPRLDDIERGALGPLDSYLVDHEGLSSRGLISLHLGWAGSEHTLDTRLYVQHRTLSLDENFTGFLANPTQGDRRLQQQSTWTPGLNVRHHWHIADHWQLTSTARWMADITEQQEDFLVVATAQPWARGRDAAFVQQWAGVSSALIWTPARWFNAEAGARLDLLAFRVRDFLGDGAAHSDAFLQVSPRTLVTLKPGGGVRLFVSYGRGLRPPEARSINPKPQDSADLDRFSGGRPEVVATDSTEVGVRWALSPALDLGVAAFGTWIESETVFDHVSGLNLSLNPTRRLGVEVDATWYLTAWLQLDADFSFIDARFPASGEPVPGVPTMIGRLQVWLGPLEGFGAGARLTGLGARPLAFGATAAPGLMLDLSTSYRWQWLETSLQMTNVLNTDWRAGEYNFASWWDQTTPRSQLPAIHVAAGMPWTLRGQLTFWF